MFKELPHGMPPANEITWEGRPEKINKSCQTWTKLAKLWMDDIK